MLVAIRNSQQVLLSYTPLTAYTPNNALGQVIFSTSHYCTVSGEGLTFEGKLAERALGRHEVSNECWEIPSLKLLELRMYLEYRLILHVNCKIMFIGGRTFYIFIFTWDNFFTVKKNVF